MVPLVEGEQIMTEDAKLPRIAIAGICGRMGRTITELASERGFKVAGGTEAPNNEFVGKSVMIGSESVTPIADTKIAAESADVWIDFTRPSATLSALEDLRSTSVKAVVIGTTGFSPQEEEQITSVSKRLAIVKAGNFSLGVTLLCHLSKIASRKVNSDWDIEILESHHRHKVDAPSGTALMLGEAIADGRGQKLSDVKREPYDGAHSVRQEGEVGFAVRRAGGIVGEHEVMIANDHEVIRLAHMASDRKVFAQGALVAAIWVADQAPGLYRIEDVLEL